MSQPASTIYTKTGDDGTTGRLFGGRITKDDLLIEACGDVDETVAALGVAREALQDNPELSDLVLDLQRHLFVVAADLSANPRARHRLTQEVSLVVATMTDDLERRIDRLIAQQALRPVFIVPGATRASAAADLARTVARRAERHLIRARAAGHTVSPDVVAYLNRLSDLLYVLARQTRSPSITTAGAWLFIVCRSLRLSRHEWVSRVRVRGVGVVRSVRRRASPGRVRLSCR